jgi:hypothetical protein
MQALFYLKTLAVVAALTSFMFHVKHYEQFQHFLSALKFSITFLENNQQTPPHPNFYKIYVDNILINVENLLRFECGEHACMFYIFKPPKLVLAQKLLKRESRKICWRIFAVLTSLMLGHFVSYMLMLGHVSRETLGAVFCVGNLSMNSGSVIILKNHQMLRCLLVISKETPVVI